MPKLIAEKKLNQKIFAEIFCHQFFLTNIDLLQKEILPKKYLPKNIYRKRNINENKFLRKKNSENFTAKNKYAKIFGLALTFLDLALTLP